MAAIRMHMVLILDPTGSPNVQYDIQHFLQQVVAEDTTENCWSEQLSEIGTVILSATEP